LIDKLGFERVGAGKIDFALRRAQNIHWQRLEVDKAARAALKHQKPRCVWFTGLSGAGKSTIANLLEKRLHAEGRHTYLLDGDNVRHGLNRDLGFTEADRVENIRRVAEVARLMVDAGLIVLVCLISPFRQDRQFARERFAPGEFSEVFVDARRLRSVSAATPKGCTPRRARDCCAISPASTARMSRPSSPRCSSAPPSDRRRRAWSGCWRCCESPRATAAPETVSAFDHDGMDRRHPGAVRVLGSALVLLGLFVQGRVAPVMLVTA